MIADAIGRLPPNLSRGLLFDPRVGEQVEQNRFRDQSSPQRVRCVAGEPTFNLTLPRCD
jgi:hypothetical protein